MAEDGSNSTAGAPADGSCSVFHVNGGGVRRCSSLGPSTTCETTVPGTICANGTIYVGPSPDDGGPMFMTPADAGMFTWNKGGVDGLTTPMAECDPIGLSGGSCNSGKDNTALLAGLSDAESPYVAASYCDTLTAHGYSDWYLPAAGEMKLIYKNLIDQDNDDAPGGPLGSTFNFDTSWSGRYWTSSELDFVHYAAKQRAWAIRNRRLGGILCMSGFDGQCR